MATVCKTWLCRACREKVKALVLARIEKGILTAGRCYLISLTFVNRRGHDQRNAASVAVAWRRLLRRLRNPNLMWFRVIELTKRNQPHLHLIVGGIGNRTANCEKHPHPYDADWRSACKFSPLCVEHEWSRAWFEATADSYVVDARPVLGAAGAAHYLGKYLTKAMGSRETLVALGFSRRWSRSQNWPTGDVYLRGTELGWDHTEWSWKGGDGYGYAAAAAQKDQNAYMLERLGDDVVRDIANKGRKRKLANKLKGLLDHESNRTKVRAQPNHNGHG